MGFIDDQKERIKNELKNKAKKETKKLTLKVLQVIAPYLLAIIGVLLVIGILFTIYYTVSEKFKSLNQESIVSANNIQLTNDNWMDLAAKYDYDGDSNTEEQTFVEKCLDELENLGISLEDLRILGEADYSNAALLEDESNKAQIEKYVKAFISADLITSQIHKTNGNTLTKVEGSNWLNGLISKYIIQNSTEADLQMLADKIDGGIYLYRTKDVTKSSGNDDGNVEQIDQIDNYYRMQYISKEQFDSKIEEFNNTGNPDVDGMEKVFSIDDSGNLWIAEVNGETKIKEVDGKEESTEHSYTAEPKQMDYQSLVSEFGLPYEYLINLCMITQNPEYVFHVAQMCLNTKIDILLINNETTKIKIKEKTETEHKDDGTTSSHTIVTTTTEKSTNPKLELRYANSWSKYQKNIWSNRVEETKSIEEGHSSKTTKIKITNTYSSIEGNIIRKSDNFLGLLRNSSGEYLIGTTPYFKLDGCKFDRYGINVKYKIPNSTLYEDPLSNLISGEEMLYSLLEQNERTQFLVELMKYYMTYPEQEYYELEEDEIEEILGGYGEESKHYVGTDYIVKTDEPGALEPVTKDQLINIINATFSGKQKSNALSIADTLIECQNKYKVNAVFVLAFARQETSVGTANTDYVKKDNNWLSWSLGTKYVTPNKNVEKVMSKMATGSIYFKTGKITITEIGYTYCPNDAKHPNQGNNWVAKVTQYVKEMYSKIGVKTESTVNVNTNNAIVEQAAKCMEYLQNNGYQYPSKKGVGIPNISQIYSTKNAKIDCSAYVSWVLYELGYMDARWDSATFAANPKNWKKITSKSDVKAGDIVVYTGHVEICAEDVTDTSKLTKYNAGSTSAIQKSPYSSGWHSNFKFALRILK